jgi:molybdopterin synthase sulfur carrier subunit
MTLRIRIPTPLRSYTAGEADVTAEGGTLDEVLRDLDGRYPGIRFRVVDEQGRLRQHMNIFVGQERCRDLSTSVDGLDEVVLMQALSGG